MTWRPDIPWPHWVLRFIASDDENAYEDAIWSVGGSPPRGGLSYKEAAAIYELLKDYRGPGMARPKFYSEARAELKNSPEWQAVLELFHLNDQITSNPETYGADVVAMVLELFHLNDQITSNPDTYGADVVARGLALSKQTKHDGILGTFLCYRSGLAYRNHDLPAAMEANWQALQIFLRLADGDSAYAMRAAQCSQNAISYLALSGDREGALRLHEKLAPILEGFDFSEE